jgi:hexosaminidase
MPSPIKVVPLPAKVSVQSGVFNLNAGVPLLATGEARGVAEQLNARLQALHGFTLPLVQAAPGGPYVELALTDAGGPEGYKLTVTPASVRLEGQASGLYYAAQTLVQLVEAGQLPALVIEDAPRFGWRGLMLDVSRHFSSIETVKRLIDTMAHFKLNTFHWHLTDDQGWRAEIRQYPRLTELGAWREATLIGHHHARPWTFDGVRHGGFYTQAQMREVVAYAAQRFVTVVPEVDMPGHMQAAIAAYPELGNFGQADGVRQVWDISEQVLGVRESTIAFMQNVISELLDIFPSPFIHLGGDECPKKEWKESAEMQALMRELGLHDEDELQSYFMRRMGAFLESRGRRLIGWDEILEGGLAPGATVMSWRGTEGGIAAARAGHDVVMTPGQHVYLDHYQGPPETEPLAIHGFTPLEKVYAYEPVPAELTEEQARHILGVQGNLWTEYMPNAQHIEYMYFPRALALAEIAWSPRETRDEADFMRRLPAQLETLKTLGVNYRVPEALRG